MKKGEQISIKGYRWVDKPRENNKGGGVGILISEKIAQNTTEDNSSDEYENLETKWIQMESRPRNLAIGVFYGPQENDCVAKVKEIYAALNNQITHKAENNEIILAGDFNAKIAIATKNCKQRESRNGKLLQKIITDNNMTVANLKADAGIWTRVNRKKSEEKSVIDYILASPYIAKGIQTLIVDEEGHLRVKGKNETDHNTITMTIKINDPRKPKFQERWRLNNKEGWRLFNKTTQLEENKSIITKGTYKQAEKKLKKILQDTIGTKRIRTDKPKRTNNKEIKEARKFMKENRNKFQTACKSASEKIKLETRKEYIESQRKLRTLIEEAETKMIEDRLENLQKRAKINPNTIWEARRRAKGCNGLEYTTYTEEGEQIHDPVKTKEHIANYFEDLYQAREGKEEYVTWTEKITRHVQNALSEPPYTKDNNEEKISTKEMEMAIKKLRRNKSVGPDKIPNEIFIEANKETKQLLKTMIENIHANENIPQSWEEGEIIRLYKGKGQKGKCSNERGITLASNVGKVYERIINERVKNQVTITKAQAGGKPGCSTVDHLIILKQTIQEIRDKRHTAYIIFLDVQKAYDKAWLDAILYALNINGVKGKNLRMIKKLNSNLTARIQTRYGLTRKINIRDSIRQGGVLSVIEYATLIDEIAKELKQRNLGYKTETNITLDSLLWMDDVCLIHYDLDKLQEILDITNHVANKYHIQFGAAKCKVIKRGNGKKSALTLNGEILEEVPRYKYLGEIINNKGNLSDHLEEIEKKIKGATATILAETGNKEFKGIKMHAVWQMVDTIIIPILTYSCEGWNPTKEETRKLQSIFNETIKTILYLPQGTPTTILLNETGNIPVEYIIKKKQILQMKRIQEMKGDALIKDATKNNQSKWRKNVEKYAEELHIKDILLTTNKNNLKRLITDEINTKILDDIANEAENKSKLRHWMERREDIIIGKRPGYMNELTRKQCNVIIRARASMLTTRTNYKKANERCTTCRFCSKMPETQEHVIQHCPRVENRTMNIEYKEIFKDDSSRLKEIATEISRIEEVIKNMSPK